MSKTTMTEKAEPEKKKLFSLFHLFIFVALSLFVTSFFLSMKFQANNEFETHQFYRRMSWNIHSIIIRNNNFYLTSKLYQSNGTDLQSYQLSYDLLWQRLDVFLVSNEVKPLRDYYPELTKKIDDYFSSIQALEPYFLTGEGLDSPQFISKLNELEKTAHELEFSLSHDITINLSKNIKNNNNIIQIWQLVSFIVSILIALVFLFMTRRSSHLAKHDSLTKLGNRRALQEYTKECFNQGKSLAIMSLDLKKFKMINDQIGYQVGDRVLLEFASKIATINGYTAFRLGGDEFVLTTLFKGDLITLREQAEYVKKQLSFAFQAREFIFQVDVRIGVSHGSREDGISADELVDQSVVAMNECKISKNDLVMYHEIVPQLVKNKQKSHLLKTYLQTENNCPLSVRLTSLYNQRNGEQELKELSLFWKKDLSECSLTWLAEERVDLKVLPKLLIKACQHSVYPVLLRLSHSYQIEQLLKTQAKNLLKYHRVIICLPLLSELSEEQLILVKKHNLLIAVETMRSDEYASLSDLSHIQYWAPHNIPADRDKYEALITLANAYGQKTLLPKKDDARVLIDG